MIGIEESTAEQAGLFNLLLLPGIIPLFIYTVSILLFLSSFYFFDDIVQALVKYVQAQGEYKYPAIVSVICCVCNVCMPPSLPPLLPLSLSVPSFTHL